MDISHFHEVLTTGIYMAVLYFKVLFFVIHHRTFNKISMLNRERREHLKANFIYYYLFIQLFERPGKFSVFKIWIEVSSLLSKISILDLDLEIGFLPCLTELDAWLAGHGGKQKAGPVESLV